MIKVIVPATSANLGPGFDFVGMALELYNEFYFFPEGTASIPEGCVLLKERSLAHKAFKLAADKQLKIPQLRIAVKSGIPRARGLGSSATLSVAGLVAGKIFTGGGLKEEEIISLAAKLEGHPDNAAPAVLGGIVLCMAAAGNVKYLKFMPEKQLKVVMAVPAFELATADARRVLPREVSHRDAVNNTGRFGFFIASLLTGDYRHLAFAMEDLLHQPYRLQLVPGMKEVMASALESGALGSCLSGAGPSIMAFCDSRFAEISSNMKKTWMIYGIKADAYILNIAQTGTSYKVINNMY